MGMRTAICAKCLGAWVTFDDKNAEWDYTTELAYCPECNPKELHVNPWPHLVEKGNWHKLAFDMGGSQYTRKAMEARETLLAILERSRRHWRPSSMSRPRVSLTEFRQEFRRSKLSNV